MDEADKALLVRRGWIKQDLPNLQTQPKCNWYKVINGELRTYWLPCDPYHIGKYTASGFVQSKNELKLEGVLPPSQALDSPTGQGQSPSGSAHLCPVCNREFKSEPALRGHKKTHSKKYRV